MVEIVKINWLSQEAQEAEVHLFDGNFNLICFSHPFNQKVGDKIEPPLYTLNVNNLYGLWGKKRFSVEKEEVAFGYKLSGKIIDKNKCQVKVGEYIIELDVLLPNDIEIDDYVSFTCDRIDIY